MLNDSCIKPFFRNLYKEGKMSLYPSLEDMKVDHMIKVGLMHFQRRPCAPDSLIIHVYYTINTYTPYRLLFLFFFVSF